jgi:molybdenum transport protein
MPRVIMPVLTTAELERLLFEDVPYGDLTTEALRIGTLSCRATFRSRAAMTIAAIEDAAALFALVGATAHPNAVSGEAVAAGQVLLECEGSAAAVLRAWKVSQTLIEVWSGVATATRLLVSAARQGRPDTIVACTRKNIPGTKALSVAAIKAGGAIPHRLGLSETILVFPEHRLLCPTADFAALARGLRAASPEKKLLVEVTSAADAMAAARAGFDLIQAEKFAPDAIAEVAAAVQTLTPRPLVAAAGGINPDNAAAYARAGADVLVTSWPYTARPMDVAVNLVAR